MFGESILEEIGMEQKSFMAFYKFSVTEIITAMTDTEVCDMEGMLVAENVPHLYLQAADNTVYVIPMDPAAAEVILKDLCKNGYHDLTDCHDKTLCNPAQADKDWLSRYADPEAGR